jgi:hypothetical protein
MPVSRIDHIYAETRSWGETVAFWEGLGFSFAERWGDAGHRAGRLVAGDAAVVVAEIPPGDDPPAFNVFFTLTDADQLAPAPEVEVVTPLQPTHWGTRWIRVADPDGRVHALEEAP